MIQLPTEEKLETADALMELARKLSAAISECTEAAATRNRIETKIAALVPTELQGQKTVSLDDGAKLTVKRGLIYKADLDRIEDALIEECRVSGHHWGTPIKYKTTRELDVTGYEWYRENQPTIFSRIVDFVTVKPRKVTITLKPTKEKT